MEVKKQDRNLKLLPHPDLNEEAIIQQINTLRPLARPIAAYGFFSSTSKPVIGLNKNSREETERAINRAAEKSTFGYDTGKITAIQCAGDSIIVQYEGPYEDNLETPTDNSAGLLVFGGPKKHFYAPFEESCWGKVIATEIDEENKKTVLYFQLQDDQTDLNLSAEKRRAIMELIENPRISKKIQQRIGQVALAVAAAISLITYQNCGRTSSVDEHRSVLQETIKACHKQLDMQFPTLPKKN